jgi:hypothetical protein
MKYATALIKLLQFLVNSQFSIWRSIESMLLAFKFFIFISSKCHSFLFSFLVLLDFQSICNVFWFFFFSFFPRKTLSHVHIFYLILIKKCHKVKGFLQLIFQNSYLNRPWNLTHDFFGCLIQESTNELLNECKIFQWSEYVGLEQHVIPLSGPHWPLPLSVSISFQSNQKAYN